MVYGYKQTNIHTHLCNAVPLVRGSLRLAPIIERWTSCNEMEDIPCTKAKVVSCGYRLVLICHLCA